MNDTGALEGGSAATLWQRRHAARQRRKLQMQHRAEAKAYRLKLLREARADLKKRKAKWLAGWNRKAAKAAGLPKPSKMGTPLAPRKRELAGGRYDGLDIWPAHRNPLCPDFSHDADGAAVPRLGCQMLMRVPGALCERYVSPTRKRAILWVLEARAHQSRIRATTRSTNYPCECASEYSNRGASVQDIQKATNDAPRYRFAGRHSPGLGSG
jgi:hypothetical protein